MFLKTANLNKFSKLVAIDFPLVAMALFVAPMTEKVTQTMLQDTFSKFGWFVSTFFVN